jgi:muramidase (phage lysozyme)
MTHLITANKRAFLDMIAFSEIGPKLLAASDNGYNVMVGGELFDGYKSHPNKLVYIPRLRLSSTAAGRYQLLYRYWLAYSRSLKLPDFSPASQDQIALQQISERKAFDDIEAGRITSAVDKCKNIWASLPGAGYGQSEQKLDSLLAAFVKAGGRLV